MKALYVEWVDATAGCGWEKIKDVEGVHDCRSLGFLIKEDDKEIIIALAVSDNECNCSMAIPKKWIKKRRVVKL